ncbi:hypothetical protein [Prevotella fusca]|uniref:hypothetical protein n=1 Tax=Prevotella fusca TaxID=589436 RepID=UPI000B07E401|nr:hypothetical protein [Prevotella fusca]
MKKYFRASMLLMGLLFVQSTTASAQCPIKEQIMNSDSEGDSVQAQTEQNKTARPPTH